MMIKEKTNANVRESNFELLRIISMLFIVVYHIIMHGGLLGSTSGNTNLVLNIIMAVCIVHVNSYVLLSGYFQSKAKFKMSKVISLNNSVWFYNVLITGILIFTGFITLNSVGILKMISPISYKDYWFITCYLLLYLISPLLNTIIENISKDKYKKTLLLLFLIESLLPTLTKNEFFDVTNGFSLYHFIFLYFIGAYLRKYPINKSYTLKNMSNNLQILLYGFISLFMIFINVSMLLASNELVKLHPVVAEVGLIFQNGFLAYNNPLIVIQTVSYFLVFSLLSFKSRFINYISAATLGVYLIHDNASIRPFLYKRFGFNSTSYGITVILRIAVVAILIFSVCIIMEIIRKEIFKFIYNRKISKKNRKFYQQYFKSLGLNINW